MISNKMRSLVNSNSTIRAMFEEGKKLSNLYGEENIFDYSIGNPSIETPNYIKSIINSILENDSPNSIHGYMNNSGYEDVRSDIAKYINQLNDLDLFKDNIIMTCGAAGGLNIILKSIINYNDEVIVFSPYFGEYKNFVENFNGKLIVVPSEIDTFEPNLETLDKFINTKTKAVIINTPNNPTGIIYSSIFIKNLSQLLYKKQIEYNSEIYLLSDEPYREIIYTDTKVPCIFHYYDNSFIVYSYSKSLSIPGERIGYVVVNSSINDFENMTYSLSIANRILGFVNAPSLFQKVIAKALYEEINISAYRNNFELLYNHLINIGFSCVKPQGTFYLFPKCPIENDVEFCENAKKYNLLLVPGSAFGYPGYFRISYCIPYKKIEKSLESFNKLASFYDLVK